MICGIVVAAFVGEGEPLVVAPFDRLVAGIGLVEIRRSNYGQAVFRSAVISQADRLLQPEVTVFHFSTNGVVAYPALLVNGVPSMLR